MTADTSFDVASLDHSALTAPSGCAPMLPTKAIGTK